MSALVVVSGPSGVGKNTVLGRVLQLVPQLVVGTSWTTRGHRADDDSGIKRYEYVDKERFLEAAQQGMLLEYAEYAGNHYGTIKPPDGQHTLLEIEVQGAQQVWTNHAEAIMIGLLPPGSDLDEMYACCEARLRGRKTDSEEKVRSRLSTARSEISTILSRWPHQIVNDEPEEAAEQICRLIHQLTDIKIG